MEIFLGKLTQHAMNHAIRSGIAITSTYAIRQCSRLLKTVDNTTQYQELQNLQERLDSKIRIISPAIDMIELISARGNTSLESAVSLTKALRWDIQSLAVRLSKAANVEEISRGSSSRGSLRAQQDAELHFIVDDIRKLLLQIEDAVPLINLAITTSGASLSTSLPVTVSPSRLLQASTFLTAGDTQFSLEPNTSVQVGPLFTLSVYMLFAGHAHRANFEGAGVRDTTWKEVIHKARVKLIRVPLTTYGQSLESFTRQVGSSAKDWSDRALLEGDGRANEFAYQLEIIEDLDDDRLHSFEDGELQPGPYKDVLLAGIREVLPIHEVSKIFYADTGKILNIGNESEPNSPVLLLKRDVNALPPRRMIERSEDHLWRELSEEVEHTHSRLDDPQSDIDYQLHQESSIQIPSDELENSAPGQDLPWQFPIDLDPEWLAFEVYTEPEDGSSGDEQEANDDSAYASALPSSSKRKSSSDSNLTPNLANLNLSTPTPSSISKTTNHLSSPHTTHITPSPTTNPFGPIRSSLSLLEMLIRLTALQQFQQASHLSIPDELLTFFLEESSTTGAGGDSDSRRQKRHQARQRVGFDPYDESPVKRRGEDYQSQPHAHHRDQETPARESRAGTPYREYSAEENEWYQDTGRRNRDFSSPSPALPSSELPNPRLSKSPSQNVSSSPQSPYLPNVLPSRRAGAASASALAGPLDRISGTGAYANASAAGRGSPLGRGGGGGVDADADSSLGTSPGMLDLK